MTREKADQKRKETTEQEMLEKLKSSLEKDDPRQGDLFCWGWCDAEGQLELMLY